MQAIDYPIITNLITIEEVVNPPKFRCSRCHRHLQESYYYSAAKRGESPGIYRRNACALCRYKMMELKSTYREQLEAEAERQRQEMAAKPRVYRDGRVWRCVECQSVLRTQIITLGPSRYSIETRCIMGDHLVAEEEREGSSVGGSVPYPQPQPVPKITIAQQGKLQKQDVQPHVTRVDLGRVDGCDDRCISFYYRSIDPKNQGTYIKTHHDPIAHNEYGLRKAGVELIDGVPSTLPSLYHYEGLVVDTKMRMATKGGQEIVLTPTEWSILAYLVNHQGKQVKTIDVVRAVWDDEDTPSQSVLRTNVGRIRAKLDTDPLRYIDTVKQYGYRLRVEYVK